eukprot:4334720-Amphidinium_carterae.1
MLWVGALGEDLPLSMTCSTQQDHARTLLRYLGVSESFGSDWARKVRGCVRSNAQFSEGSQRGVGNGGMNIVSSLALCSNLKSKKSQKQHNLRTPRP